MNCPKCSGELRELTSAEGVTLDFCSGCKGLWFDPGEVSAYFELSKDIPDLDAARATAATTELACPKCGKPLEEMRYTAASDLVIDRCSGCGGIWLDAGEVPRLEKLAARIESPRSRLLGMVKGLKDQGYEILGTTRG